MSVLHHWYFSKIVSYCGINKVNHCYYICVGPVACKQRLIPWQQCFVLLTDTIKQRTAVRTCLDVWLGPLSMVENRSIVCHLIMHKP